METESPIYIPRRVPFLHVQVEGIFGDGLAGARIARYIDAKSWLRQSGPAHQFWSLDAPLNLDCAIPDALSKIKRHHSFLESSLKLKLLREPTIDVFKLTDGDGIGFHDDADVSSVRLVMKLHQDCSKSRGGELLLTGGHLKDTYIYPLEGDSGVGFATQPGNLHAISSISGDPARFLVAQYWTMGQ